MKVTIEIPDDEFSFIEEDLKNRQFSSQDLHDKAVKGTEKEGTTAFTSTIEEYIYIILRAHYIQGLIDSQKSRITSKTKEKLDRLSLDSIKQVTALVDKLTDEQQSL